MSTRRTRAFTHRRCLFAGALTLAALSSCGPDQASQAALTQEEAVLVLRWLTCDECGDGELQYVLDSIGSAATPMLAEALLDTPEEYLANVERALRLAWSRREAPLVDVDTYVAEFSANYRRTLQMRAVRALGGLGEVAILEQAYNDRGPLGFQPGVVAAIEDELVRVGGGGAGFVPPAIASILLRPDSVELEPNEEVVLEGLPLDAGGRMRPATLQWSISDSGIAEPIAGGGDSTWIRVRGAALGRAIVTVVADGLRDSAVAIVAPPGPPAGRLVIVSGNGQEFPSGGGHLPLVVRVENGTGIGVAGAQVTFRATRGANVDAVAITNGDGEARLEVIPAPSPGAVWIDVTAAASPATFGLELRPSMVRFQLRVLP